MKIHHRSAIQRGFAVCLLAILGSAVLMPISSTLRAQTTKSGVISEAPEGVVARLPVRLIGGRLVARLEASTRFRRIPVNLFVELDRPCGLELHNRAAAGLKVDEPGGKPIKLRIPGFDITVADRELGDEDGLNLFTRLYSKELGETACVGTIGGEILDQFHVTFDLNQGFVFLEAQRKKTDNPPEEAEGSITTNATFVNNQVWVPVFVKSGNKRMALALSTLRHDSLVDRDLCDQWQKPDGNLGPISIGAMDLSRYVAWRPSELALVHPDGALGSMGLGMLSHFKIEIDRVNRFVRWTPTVPPAFPKEDLTFFQALLEEESEPLAAWLEKHPEARLAREGSERLVNLLLEEDGDAEAFKKALGWMNRTRIEDLRCTESLSTMQTLITAQRKDLAIVAGELGIEGGRKDRYPESVHKVHSKLGELLLEAKKPRDAWEHLLSAAFGLPEDGLINYNLGKFYELEGRFSRARSRYIQAIIQPETGTLAVEALRELTPKMEDGKGLSVDLVSKLISGKVYNFSSATKYEAPAENPSNRCVLAEFFTNPHLAQKLPEGWRSFAVGGAMGVEGLLSFFPRERCVVLTYHCEQPEPSPLMNEVSEHQAAAYSVGPDAVIINGHVKGRGAGRWRKAEQIFEALKELVMSELDVSSDFTLAGKASISKDGKLSGHIEIAGEESNGILLQIVLAERGVLCPGKAQVVVHQMVARHWLTGSSGGIPFEPKEGKMRQSFSVSLEDVATSNAAWLKKFQADGRGLVNALSTVIDPRQVSVIAYVRDRFSGEILQAVQIDAELPAELKSGAEVKEPK